MEERRIRWEGGEGKNEEGRGKREEGGGKEVNNKRLNKEHLITVIEIQDKCICSSLAITFIY